MFVDLVVPQNIFFDAKSGKIRISLRTFLKSFSGNTKIREIINLYDYDRIDPSTHKKRPIQPEEVYENVNNVETL